MSARRALFLGIGVLLAVGLTVARAQPPQKAHRVGVLWAGSASPAAVAAFKQEMRRLGYEQGRNLALEERFLVGDLGRFSDYAGELLALKVDVLVMTSTRSAVAAAKLTSTVPIVVTSSGDLLGTGLATSFARPGRNVTGLSTLSPELTPKRLQLLKELVPGLKRVAVIWNPDGPAPALAFKETLIAARGLGLEIHSVEVRKPAELERALSLPGLGNAHGLLVVADPLVAGNVARIVKLVAEARLVAVYPQREFADAGGLAAYGPSYVDLYRRSAHYVDRILRGAKAAEIPIERPVKFELVINSKSAKALGFVVPPRVLVQADAVIE